tara:strand:- start:908 stop:2560 length:1653 start_codon:yes stop_codon:yes gene_type:complete
MSNVKRFMHIIRIICIFGLDELVPTGKKSGVCKVIRWLFFFWRNQHQDKLLCERFKLALQELGPIYIKLGQMLSTRRDMLDEAWIQQLVQLQDQVLAFSSEQAISLIEEQLGQPLTDLFTDFDPEPMASASIAQVHSARLKASGDQVVLKVRRPNLEEVIEADLNMMMQCARIMESLFTQSKSLRLLDLIQDYKTTIYHELDFVLEAQHTSQLRANFAQSSILYVPKVHKAYCSEGLLVLERIEGIRIDDKASLEAHQVDLKKLAERGVEIFFTQVFRDNFFHADMHPGNIFVAKEHPQEPQYIGIDCGIIGRLSEQDKTMIAQCFLAFFRQNYQDMAKIFIHSGWVQSSTHQYRFEQDIARLCQPLFQKPLHEISFAHFLIDLFKLAKLYNFRVQPQLFLLQKTLLYIEGLGRQLYPELDLWQTAQPFLENWLRERVSPKETLKRTRDLMPKIFENLPDIPELVYDNLHMGRKILSSQQELLQQYALEQRKSQRSYFLLITAGFLFLGCLIVGLNPNAFWWEQVLFGLGAFLCWIIGWTSRVKNYSTSS